MNQTVIERKRKFFNGTAEELLNLITSHIQISIPETEVEPEGYSRYLELRRVMDDPELFFIERPRQKKTKTEEGEIVEFLDPRREGTFRIRTAKQNPPLAELIYRAYTEDCRQLVRAIVDELALADKIAVKPEKPNRRQNKIQSRSIRGMLELIAYRESIRRNGEVIAWTFNPFGDSGRVDIDTAEKIAGQYGNEIKTRWDDRKYDAKPFAEKLITDNPSLSDKWDELKTEYSL
jgi:hypothetical protein